MSKDVGLTAGDRIFVRKTDNTKRHSHSRLYQYGTASFAQSAMHRMLFNSDNGAAFATSLEYGARPLRRAIEHHLEDPMAEDLLRGTFDGKDTITVKTIGDKEDKKLTFESTGTARELVAAESGTGDKG